MYKLLSIAKDFVDLSIVFDRDRNRKQRELTNNKHLKAKYQLRNLLRDAFGSSEHQEKATYG